MDAKKITQKELLPFVLDALRKNEITEALPTLEASFPNYPSMDLFRTLVLQQAWVHVCSNQIEEASKLIEALGEAPSKQLTEMWRQTTRNSVRGFLYEYLHKQGYLSPQDERSHEVLLKITTKYPNTSFVSAQRQNQSPAMKVAGEMARQPQWEAIIDVNSDFNENRGMLFPELFKIPEEPRVENGNYFLGNIALIESQTPETLKALLGDEVTMEGLWVLHCEHKMAELEAVFKKELEKVKDAKQLKCLEFVNTYLKQMNVYEQETLLDILCRYGVFANEELGNFEALLLRICKGKILFDNRWWSQIMFPFEEFFKKFAKYCGDKNLFMPFEMFVVAHPEVRQFDISDVEAPMIKFIWDMWVKRDMSAAALSCVQSVVKSGSTDLVELWKSLPQDSLAPLASFVWNKDPARFQPGSPEIEALAERLKGYYPLLASLVKGNIPHPESEAAAPKESQWRAPVFTSKYDMELHDLIASHFQYDFSKVFTDYYGKTPGQPPYPHFDHPELITSTSDPPYVQYVRAMLPVSAFQQAHLDHVSESKFAELCVECMRVALRDKQIRLAALTFIELTDQKFNSDHATDYKIALAIYDGLSVDNDPTLVDELSKFFGKKCQASARSIQQKLAPTELEPFLLSALLGVRCKLPLEYSAISYFSRQARCAELLLYLDRAEEIGAKYNLEQVVKIIQTEMPENPLKEHLLFHLTQVVPDDAAAESDSDQPAVIVYRALRRKDQPQAVSLLQEALKRKEKLYALLATSISGANMMVCALVTLLTMVADSDSLDVTHLPGQRELNRLFLQTVAKLLLDGKSRELIHVLGLFSQTSLATQIANWYHAVEDFTFGKAETALIKVNEMMGEKETMEDDLLGVILVSDVLDSLYPLQDALAQHCVKKSQIHLFRYLQLLQRSHPSPSLKLRVQLAGVIEKFENYRRAIVKCDLLGDYDKIVSDLVLCHSLTLGQAAATCLGTSAALATQQWLKFQYESAENPSQVLDVHSRIAPLMTDVDPLFFVALFASLLPYSQPSLIVEILRFARQHFTEDLSDFGKQVDALLLHLRICAEKSIEVAEDSQPLPALEDVLKVLFPDAQSVNIPKSVPLSIKSPVRFSTDSLQRFFENSINTTVDACLDTQRLDDAKMLCEWRQKNMKSILLLEAVQSLISGTELSSDSQSLISKYGSEDDTEKLLESISHENGWRFMLISLHFKAAKLLGLNVRDLASYKTTDLLGSQLVMSKENWDLVRNLISAANVRISDVADCLVDAFTKCATGEATVTLGSPLSVDDMSDDFRSFVKLCGSPTAVGDRLLAKAQQLKAQQPLSVIVNLVLHASFFTTDIDRCAQFLDSLFDSVSSDDDQVIHIFSTFPEPALLPRYFHHIFSNNKLDLIPKDKIDTNLGQIILSCAHRTTSFDPQPYLEFTLSKDLFREHAMLQMECGTQLLAGTPDAAKLQEASKHLLLALAYFLHEKSYSLALESLKKLSLISLQQEHSDQQLLHLTQSEVLSLICTKEFPVALTLAVAYDADTEVTWAQAIFEQSIKKKGDEYLQAFQCFRPVTMTLCGEVMKLFRSTTPDDATTSRMKQFLKSIPNLVERYRIAKQLEFYDQIQEMNKSDPTVCEWCEKVGITN